VYARHGHQFDLWNFGGRNDYARAGHLKAAIGDVFTTEFAVKIPWKLEQMRGDFQDVTPALVEKTKDIDNVRPLSAVMEWIYYRMKKDVSGDAKEAFETVFDEVVRELLDNRFVQQWRSPHTHLDEALRLASSPWLSWLPKGLTSLLEAEDLLPLVIGATGGAEDPERDVYTRAAYGENIWRENENIRFILYGHTHRPVQRPLDGEGGREVFYINTGTWRSRIQKTVGQDHAPDFIDQKRMTYSMFYRGDEDTRGKVPDTLSFDVWTGTKKKQYGKG
jgi:hypothetical protein